MKSRRRFGGALEPATHVLAHYTERPKQELVRLVRLHAPDRYPDGVPAKVEALLEKELALIEKLDGVFGPGQKVPKNKRLRKRFTAG